MNYFVLLIFCIFNSFSFGMEKYSRLEQLPVDLKMNVIKQIIARAATGKKAIASMKVLVVADRLFRNHHNYPYFQAVIESHLGWQWNDDEPLPFIPDTFTSQLFDTLPVTDLTVIQDPDLCKSQQSFAHFCKLLQEKKTIPEDILNGIDLQHRYKTHELYQDATLAISRVRKETPLCAATRSNDLKTVERLLQLGCDTQQCSDKFFNPLHWACMRGYKEIVALFITYNVPLDTPTPVESKTAMHLAAQTGHMDIMHMLVRAGAKRDIKNSQGLIPAECIEGRIEVG